MERPLLARAGEPAPVDPSRSPGAEPGTGDGDEPHERRNHWLHILEGATLIGALGAINSNTVGTSLVESLGGQAWMVALMPLASTLGFAVGPILNAHRLDRQTQFLPALRKWLPLSRLPIALVPVALWLC